MSSNSNELCKDFDLIVFQKPKGEWNLIYYYYYYYNFKFCQKYFIQNDQEIYKKYIFSSLARRALKNLVHKYEHY